MRPRARQRARGAARGPPRAPAPPLGWPRRASAACSLHAATRGRRCNHKEGVQADDLRRRQASRARGARTARVGRRGRRVRWDLRATRATLGRRGPKVVVLGPGGRGGGGWRASVRSHSRRQHTTARALPHKGGPSGPRVDLPSLPAARTGHSCFRPLRSTVENVYRILQCPVPHWRHSARVACGPAAPPCARVALWAPTVCSIGLLLLPDTDVRPSGCASGSAGASTLGSLRRHTY